MPICFFPRTMNRMRDPKTQLSWFLFVTALIMLSAAGAIVMPYEMMRDFYANLGLGELPNIPLVGYLTRSVSALYALSGATYWFLSRDIDRYLPFLRFSVLLTAVFNVVLILIDVGVEMPLYWTLGEGGFLAAWTAAFWWLVRRVEPSE